MDLNYIKIAKILNIKPEALFDLENKMAVITGKKNIINKIAQENEILIKRTLQELGVPDDKKHFNKIFEILLNRFIRIDSELYEFLGEPDLSKISKAAHKLCEAAIALNNPPKGFFIKKSKAIELLEKFPPTNLIEHFGYKTAEELVEKKGLASVFSSLRFAQSEA